MLIVKNFRGGKLFVKTLTDWVGDGTGPPVSESENINSSVSCLMWQTTKHKGYGQLTWLRRVKVNSSCILLGLLGKVSKFFSFSSQLTIKFLSSSSLLLLLVGRILAISLNTEWTLSFKSALFSSESKSETKQVQNGLIKIETKVRREHEKKHKITTWFCRIIYAAEVSF